MSTAIATTPVTKEETAYKTPRKLNSTKTSTPCVLPILDGKPTADDTAIERYDKTQNESFEGIERDQTFLSSANDFIPIDILNSLTHVPSPPSKDLGPASKHKKLKPIENGTGPPARRRPANVWNYPKGREKLKHLTEQPPCLCGAGKDISFLYDAVNHTCKDKPSPPETKTKVKLPASVQKQLRDLDAQDDRMFILQQDTPKKEDSSLIPDTLVPAEYHIVKNLGVLGLEFHDDKYTTHLQDHEEHLTVFPSMKPAGRGEVLKLKHTMDSLLTRAGVDDNDKELTGPTQIHNLLELVKKEQNIYNVCFNEIIRQVTVECSERGELLANIRKRYSYLLDRIPRQVKSLHQEVIAQRALDRRLTEELVRFKDSISALTSELASVKAHDREVTKQAVEAQKELEDALLESDKNASLLAEYHDLYELQRKRLETQVGKLTEERDLWGSAAYTLAMKVTDRHSLNTAKKLHLCEKAWARLTRHFAIFLSEKDSIQLESLTQHVQLWREKADQFNKQLEESEDQTRTKLQKLVDQWARWKKEFEKMIDYDVGNVTQPTRQFITKLHQDFTFWEETFNEEAERFTGEVLLSREDELTKMNEQVDKWTDVAMKVFGRHQTPAGERWPQHGEMKTLNQEVDVLHQQFHVRTIGENGVAKGIIDLVNPIETWCNKLDSILHGGDIIQDNEWIRLAELVGTEWTDHLTNTILLIGSTQKEGERVAGEPEKKLEVKDMVLKMAKWLTATNNSIDNEDGKIVQKVALTHSSMIRWMITVLLRLAPDMEDKDLKNLSTIDDKTNVDSSIGGGAILLQSTSEEIMTRANQLFDELRMFSTLLSKCCNDLVFDSMQQKKDEGDEHAEMEYKDLKRINNEFESWIRTAKLLIQEVTGEDYIPQDKPDNKTKKKQQTKTDEDSETRSTTPGEGKPEEKNEDSVTPVPSEEERAKSASDGKPTIPSPKGITPVATLPSPKGITPVATPEPPKVTEPTSEDKEDAPPPSDVKEEAGKTEEEGEEKKQDDDSSKMHVLCHDDNIRTKSLDNLSVDQETASLDVPESDGVPARSPTPDTKKALEALAAVERLQTQLLETEERAQGSEERAIQAETELKQALERIRALERSVSRASAASTRSPAGQQTPSDRPVSSNTLKRPTTQTPTAPRSPTQLSTRSSTRTSSRKK